MVISHGKVTKLNLKNSIIGLSATTAVVAPIATLVACGANTKQIIDIKGTGILSDSNNGTAGLDGISDEQSIKTELRGILHDADTLISMENGIDKVYQTTLINELASSMSNAKTPQDLGIILPQLKNNISVELLQLQPDDTKGELLAKLKLTATKGTLHEEDTNVTIKVVGYKVSQQVLVQQNTNTQVITQLTPEQRLEKFAAESTAKYSRQSLMNEAKLYNDNTTWNRGVAYHSMGAAVSFMKSLAESYGWKRSDYASKSNITVIDKINEDNAQIVPATSSKFNQVNALRLLRADATQNDNTKRSMYFEVGDNEGGVNNDFTSSTFETFGIKKPNYDYANKAPLDFKNSLATWTGYPDDYVHQFKNQAGNDFTVETSDVFSYSDAKIPGQMDVAIIDHKDNIERIVSVPGAFDLYPILSDEHLKNNIQPFLESLIVKFVDVFMNIGSTANDYVPEETRDQLRFLLEKNTITDPNNSSKSIFKIDSNQLFTHLKELNNGSQHWLALKAYYLGFDTSLGNKYNYYDVGSWPMHSRFASDSELSGVKDMRGGTDFAKWAHWNQLRLATFVPNGQKTDSLIAQRINFIATKTDEELDNIYKAKLEDFKTEDFIREYSAELHGVVTLGKTLAELRAIVFNKIITDASNVQAVANIKARKGSTYFETISLEEAKKQITTENENIAKLVPLKETVRIQNEALAKEMLPGLDQHQNPDWELKHIAMFKNIFYSQFTEAEAARLMQVHADITPPRNIDKVMAGFLPILKDMINVNVTQHQAREASMLTLPSSLVNQMTPGYILNMYSYHANVPELDIEHQQIKMTRFFSMVDYIVDNNFPGSGLMVGYDGNDSFKLHFVQKDEANKLALFYVEIPGIDENGHPKTHIVDLWFQYADINYKDNLQG